MMQNIINSAEIMCPPIDDYDIKYSADVNNTAFESRVNVTCKTGHIFQNGSTELISRCLSNGSWSLMEPCVGKNETIYSV